MTPEQLDEIEKLAEAATPGPWATEVDEYDIESGAHSVAIYHLSGKEQAWSDAAFIRAMREHALPLVKAVRVITAERDAALAEVARLQEHVDWLLEGRAQQEQRLALEADE